MSMEAYRDGAAQAWDALDAAKAELMALGFWRETFPSALSGPEWFPLYRSGNQAAIDAAEKWDEAKALLSGLATCTRRKA